MQLPPLGVDLRPQLSDDLLRGIRFARLPEVRPGSVSAGMEFLAGEIDKPAKSLHRMRSKSGNPTMSNISAVFAAIKRALKVEVRTQIVTA